MSHHKEPSLIRLKNGEIHLSDEVLAMVERQPPLWKDVRIDNKFMKKLASLGLVYSHTELISLYPQVFSSDFTPGWYLFQLRHVASESHSEFGSNFSIDLKDLDMEFKSLDKLLALLAPDLSVLRYKKMLTKHRELLHISDFDYYNNGSHSLGQLIDVTAALREIRNEIEFLRWNALSRYD